MPQPEYGPYDITDVLVIAACGLTWQGITPFKATVCLSRVHDLTPTHSSIQRSSSLAYKNPPEFNPSPFVGEFLLCLGSWSNYACQSRSISSIPQMHIQRGDSSDAALMIVAPFILNDSYSTGREV
jgi:hypothetical protein